MKGLTNTRVTARVRQKCAASSTHRGRVTEGKADRDSCNGVFSQWGVVRSTKTSYITLNLSEEYISLYAGSRIKSCSGISEPYLFPKSLFLVSPKTGNSPVYHHCVPPEINLNTLLPA